MQREDTPKEKTNEEKFKEAGDKLKDAFLATPLGKELQEKVKQDKLVKGATEAGKSFISTLPGKIITGAAAAGAVATLAALHKELPAQVPEIPLDVLTPGLSVQITYKGPVDKPTEAMISFKYSEQAPGGGGEKKPALTRAEKQRAENAVMAADQAKFRAGMRYPPGSPEDLQQRADEEAARRALAKYAPGPDLDAMVKKYPWLQAPQPKSGPQLDMPKPSFGYKPPALLGDEYKLKLPGEQKKKDDEPVLQRQASSAATVDTAPPVVHEVLQSPGQPLATDTRAFMEPRFGHDFGQVRIHADARAAESAPAVNAAAYTVGRDVVFGAGQYAPNSEGQRLLAHELTHVVQQRRDGPALHRQVYGPKATATPADWKDKVSNATTSVDRAALIQSIVSPVKVVDKTAAAAADAAVDPKNCIKWDDANPTVSYDDGLNAKRVVPAMSTPCLKGKHSRPGREGRCCRTLEGDRTANGDPGQVHLAQRQKPGSISQEVLEPVETAEVSAVDTPKGPGLRLHGANNVETDLTQPGFTKEITTTGSNRARQKPLMAQTDSGGSGANRTARRSVTIRESNETRSVRGLADHAAATNSPGDESEIETLGGPREIVHDSTARTTSGSGAYSYLDSDYATDLAVAQS